MSMLSQIGIILAIVSIYILIKNLDNPSGNILQLCLAGIVLGVILFFVGFDWGRWIFSLFHLSFFSFLMLNNKINKNKTWSFAIGAFILVSLLTIMPECCLQMEGTTVSSNYYRVLKSIQLTLQSTFG